MRLHIVALMALLMNPAQSLHAQWEKICSARQSFFQANLRPENYQAPKELLEDYTSDPNVNLIILAEAHYQPSLPKTLEYIRFISQNPEYNCLFVEATEESWQDDIELSSSYHSGHPLHFIKEFYEEVAELPMTLRLVDEHRRLEAWFRDHHFPMTEEQLKRTAYEEITYRNMVMSQRIVADIRSHECNKAVLLIGVSHLSTYSRGFRVSNIRDLLLFRGLTPRAVHLLDSELFVGMDETLKDSIPSPSLCFSACPNNPDLPTTEVAFKHTYPEEVSRMDLALIDAGKIDVHYGAPTLGLWSDFDATIIFPPRFVNSCQDARRF